MPESLQDTLLLVASFLLILGGVTYWLYSYIEQQQRKLGVLENVIYELRFTLQSRSGSGSGSGNDSGSGSDSGSGNGSGNDSGTSKNHFHNESPAEHIELPVDIEEPRYSNPPESVTDEVEHTVADFELDLPDALNTGMDEDETLDNDALRPGGTVELDEDEIMASWSKTKPATKSQESQFKSLFVSSEKDSSTVQTGSPLESMTMKDLRALGTQRKISGAKSMKRAELLEALRSADGERTITLPIGVSAPQNTLRSLE